MSSQKFVISHAPPRKLFACPPYKLFARPPGLRNTAPKLNAVSQLQSTLEEKVENNLPDNQDTYKTKWRKAYRCLYTCTTNAKLVVQSKQTMR